MRPARFLPFIAVLLAACTIEAQPTQTGIRSSAEFQLASSESSSVMSEATTPAMQERALSGGTLEIGRANAPVQMTLYINHSSPYSKQFAETYLPWLVGDFVTKNDLRISIIPVAFAKYPRSTRDASLLACGTQNGKGYAVNAMLFTQPADALIPQKLTELGLDPKAIAACVQTTKPTSPADITLVPAYAINGESFTGLPEYADLRGQINAVLK